MQGNMGLQHLAMEVSLSGLPGKKLRRLEFQARSVKPSSPSEPANNSTIGVAHKGFVLLEDAAKPLIAYPPNREERAGDLRDLESAL